MTKTVKKSKPIKQEAKYGNYTFIMIHSNKENKLTHFIHSFSSLKERQFENVELIVINSSHDDNLQDTLMGNANLRSLADQNHLKIKDSMESLNKQLIESVSQALFNTLIICDLSSLQQSINVQKLISDNNQKSEGVYLYKTNGQYENRYDSYDFLVMTKNAACNLLSKTTSNDHTIFRELSYYINKMGDNVIVKYDQEFQLNKATRKRTLKELFNLLHWFYNWFISVPINELRGKNGSCAFGEKSIYRLLFISVVAISLILMLFFSKDAGISGDEWVNYQHAEYVYNYYKTLGKDTTAIYTPTTKLQYYGQSFDNLTYLINKAFKVEKVYEARHLLNTTVGWLAMLFTALIAVLLFGWRAGFITFIIILFSPRFLGHAWNNPKDIPFAFTYIFSLYYLIRFLKEYPKAKPSTYIWLTLGIAMAISVRIGGLLLIPYLFLFGGLYYLFFHSSKGFLSGQYLNKLFRLLSIIGIISLAGYFLGQILWPYALQSPLKNPYTAFKEMVSFSAALRQLFDGKIIWSDAIPWYYTPKYILISVPIILFVGLFSLLVLIWHNKSKIRSYLVFVMVFTAIFPVFYIAYKGSNVYGGWRHAMFAYPPLALIAGIGINLIFENVRNKVITICIWILFAASFYHPVKHIVKNHPYQYIYYNELYGGIRRAFGNYEMDYYYHGLKGASDWLIENIDTIKTDGNQKIIVATNHLQITSYFLRHDTDVIKPIYVRYYERGNSDWDYALIANSYLNPYQLKKKIWPPKGTVYTVDIDGFPIAAVIKRDSKDDYYGYQALQKNDLANGIAYLEKAVKDDPANEVALLNLSQVMLSIRNFNKAIEYANMCLKVYPNYDRALEKAGIAYLNIGDNQNALAAFSQIMKVNYKYYIAYYYMAVAYAQMNNLDAAIQNAQKTLEFNGNYKPAYFLMAQLLKSKGMNAEAERYIEAGNSIK